MFRFDANADFDKEEVAAKPEEVGIWIFKKKWQFYLVLAACIILLILLIASSICLIVCLCKRRKNKKNKESKKSKKDKKKGKKNNAVTAIKVPPNQPRKVKTPILVSDSALDKTQSGTKKVEPVLVTPLPSAESNKGPAPVKEESSKKVPSSQKSSKQESSKREKSNRAVPAGAFVAASAPSKESERDAKTAQQPAKEASLKLAPTPATPLTTDRNLITPVGTSRRRHKKKPSASKSSITAPETPKDNDDSDSHSTDCSCSDSNRSEKPKEHIHAKPEDAKAVESVYAMPK